MFEGMTWFYPPFALMGHYFFGILMSVTAVFLILLVLIQRGRGGGLAGAFGGMGGQSAFGTKAGDTFTRITIGVAMVWIVISVGAVRFLGTSSGPLGDPSAPDAAELDAVQNPAQKDQAATPESGATGAEATAPPAAATGTTPPTSAETTPPAAPETTPAPAAEATPADGQP